MSELDDVYGSATARKLCIVPLWLPEAFLAVHASLAGFENHLWEPALCLCCRCSPGQGCVQAAAGMLCSAGVSACLELAASQPCSSLLSLCPAHLHQRSSGLVPQTRSICRKGSGRGCCRSRDSWALWAADLADR